MKEHLFGLALVSIFSRIQTFAESLDGDGWRGDPWALYLTGLTKPIVGVFIAWIVFAIYQSGMLPLSFKSETQAYWIAIVGFLSGFSERFFKDLSGGATERLSEDTQKGA